MRKNKSLIRKPSFFWTTVAYVLLWPIFRIRYNVHIDKKEIKGMKGPYVLLCNHAQGSDPYFVGGALYPKLPNFVGSYNHFNNKLFKFFLKRMGAIPKFQYQTDLNSTIKMISVCKRGGILGIFPTGRNSSCGEGFTLPLSISKLVKLCKSPVVICHIDGSYLSHPKWAKYRRKGPVFLKFYKLFSKEEVLEKSENELNQKINEALAFNDYNWNEVHQYKYKGKDFAVGLETTCYVCPKCHSEFEMVSSHNDLKCSKCGLKFTLNEKGFYEPNKYFKNPFEHFEYQRICINNEIKNLDTIIEDSCVCKMNTDKGLIRVGEGKITLYKDKIVYKGTISNDEKVLEFPLQNLFSIPYKVGENIELADEKNIYQFVLNHGIMAVKWSLVVEELYKSHLNL